MGDSGGVVSGVASRVLEVHTSVFGDGGGDVGVGISVVCAWKVMLLVIQSINGLYRASQQCPKMIIHEESNDVTKNVSEVVSPEVKVRLKSTAEIIEELEEPSKRWSIIGGTEYVGILCFSTNEESMKQ